MKFQRHGVRIERWPLTHRMLLAMHRREPLLETPMACFECTAVAPELYAYTGRLLCETCLALTLYRKK
jgi:hypothetical protein